MTRKKSFVEHLCTIMRERGTLTEQQAQGLSQAFAGKSRLMFENFVLEEGLVPRTALLEALAAYYRVQAFDAAGYFFDHLLVTKIPRDVLINHGIIPLEVEDDTILIVVASVPDDPDLLDVIGRFVSWDVQFFVGLQQDIIDAIEEYYDEPLTVSHEDEYLPEEERDEEKAREISRRIIKP
jgi:hypothetical protein